MICVKPRAVPSSLMTSGRPTTARISSAAMTRNSLNRSAAFHVNPAMAKILCISNQINHGWTQMHTDENRNHALKFIRVYPCPSVIENHFLPPSSDDNFSSALDKSTGSGASVLGAVFSDGGAGAVGCASAASLLSSTFGVALSAAGLAATGCVCGSDNFSKTLSRSEEHTSELQ